MTSTHFVGRQQYINQLSELLKQNSKLFTERIDDEPFRIVSIWGKAGVGKTSLVDHVLKNEHGLVKNQLVLRAEKSKFPQSIASISTIDFPRSAGIPEKLFKEIKACRKIIQKLDIRTVNRALKRIIKDKAKRDEIRNELFKEFGLLGLRYLNKKIESLLRESSVLNQYADQLIESFQDRTPTRSSRITSAISPNRSFRLQVDIDKELADSLLIDIRKILASDKNEKKSLLLIFDDFEAIGTILERFLLYYFLKSLKVEKYRTLVIVIGRDEIPWTTDWNSFSRHKEASIGLNVLEELEARSLLNKMGIIGEQIVDDILKKSYRLPLLLEILGQAYKSGRQTMWIEDYFNRITYQMSESEKEWLQALCFLDVRIDKDTVEKMLPDKNANQVLEWFKSEASARISTNEGWQLDPIIKAIVRERVSQDGRRQTIEYKERAEAARKYHDELLKKLST